MGEVLAPPPKRDSQGIGVNFDKLCTIFYSEYHNGSASDVASSKPKADESLIIHLDTDTSMLETTPANLSRYAYRMDTSLDLGENKQETTDALSSYWKFKFESPVILSLVKAMDEHDKSLVEEKADDGNFDGFGAGKISIPELFYVSEKRMKWLCEKKGGKDQEL